MPKPAPSPVPEGMNTITTQLWFDGNCGKAIELYRKAFGAELVGDIAYGPDRKTVMHAMMRLGNSHIMMCGRLAGRLGESS